MQLRDLTINDLVILEENNTIPNLFNGPFKMVKSIENEKGLIGSFWVRATVEPTMIFKSGIGRLTKARALDEMIKFLYDKVPEQLGISDAFIIFERDFDASYISFLEKHYDFEEIRKVLRIRRDDGK